MSKRWLARMPVCSTTTRAVRPVIGRAARASELLGQLGHGLVKLVWARRQFRKLVVVAGAEDVDHQGWPGVLLPPIERLRLVVLATAAGAVGCCSRHDLLGEGRMRNPIPSDACHSQSVIPRQGLWAGVTKPDSDLLRFPPGAEVRVVLPVDSGFSDLRDKLVSDGVELRQIRYLIEGEAIAEVDGCITAKVWECYLSRPIRREL